MSPFLATGDELSVKEAAAKELFLGDIIVYKRGGEFVVHRFISLKQSKDAVQYIEAKADNYLSFDDPVAGSLLLGRVVGIRRKGRQIDLNRNRWRFFSRIIGRLSFLEAGIFENMARVKRIYFKGMKIDLKRAYRILRLIKGPKFLLSRLFLRYA